MPETGEHVVVDKVKDEDGDESQNRDLVVDSKLEITEEDDDDTA